MPIVLFNRLKKKLHQEIALLQDELIDIVYAIEPNAVLHGGTAIWRCFKGNRFSEDLDFYLIPSKNFKENFFASLKSRNLVLLKFKQTSNAIYAKISNNVVEVRFECALRKSKNFIISNYEKTDGSNYNIFSLNALDLLKEKALAFQNRKLVRDFYDVFFLSSFVEITPELKTFFKKLFSDLKKPVDEKNLKILVLNGAVPSFEQMLSTLKRRFSI